MIKRTHFRIVVVLFVLLLPVFILRLDDRHVIAKQAGDPNGVVLFCVSSPSPGYAVMEPVMVIEAGKFVNPIAGDADTAVLTKFAETYYGAGKKYRLIFGSGDGGSITIKKSMMDSECFRAGAAIGLSTRANVNLNRNVMALATNSNGLGRGQSSRRAPTSIERIEAIRLAKAAFTANGAPSSTLSSLAVVNLSATNIVGDESVELIGTFVLKKSKGGAARYVLFLIAEPQGKSYRPALTNFEKYTSKDIMSGGSLDSIGKDGIYTERLVDVLDLDNDSEAEVFSIANSFESVTYTMYKKVSGAWKSVYEFNSYRCGF